MPPFVIDHHSSESTDHEMVTPDDLRSMAANLVTVMLGLDFRSVVSNQENHEVRQLMAAVRISGRWNTTLQIYASLELARKIARAMFGQHDLALGEDDVLDAFGEVANVIGGNLKGRFDKDSTLSLPCVGIATLDASADGVKVTCGIDDKPLTLVLNQK